MSFFSRSVPFGSIPKNNSRSSSVGAKTIIRAKNENHHDYFKNEKLFSSIGKKSEALLVVRFMQRVLIYRNLHPKCDSSAFNLKPQG